MINLRVLITLLSLLASAFAGHATAQTAPNSGTATTAPAVSPPATTATDPAPSTSATEAAPKTAAKTTDKPKAKPKRMTRQQEIDKSIDSGTVPARYRSSVPKEYQQYIPFDKK
jgi:hypothetical protein